MITRLCLDPGFTSTHFQEFLRRLDEAALWGRAPKRGTRAWALRVKEELLGN